MKYYYFLSMFLVVAFSSGAQNYMQMIEAGTYTISEIQQTAEAHFAEVGTGKGTGFKTYKRWEYRAVRNSDQNGMLKSPEFYINELQSYNARINENLTGAQTSTGTWEELGPTSWTLTGGYNPGIGRITSLAFENGNPNHMIVGGVTGGVWKTLDGGNTWSVLTDNMPTLLVNSLTIDPTNASIYFWGSTGGRIFRSTDAGATWNLYSDMGSGAVNKIVIDPSAPNKMYCSSENGGANGGLKKSTDGGLSWTLINPTAVSGYDIEFKPGDFNTIYASGNQFYKSSDGGASFNVVTGFSSGPKMIGVSQGSHASDADVVYVIEANSGGFGNLYKSLDSGTNFTTLDHTGKNYFGYNTDASAPDIYGPGNAPRDMDIAVHSSNIDEITIAGINTWRSTNGGVDFDITSQWFIQQSNALNIGYCHADVDLLYYVDGKLYVCSDGGVFVADTPEIVDSNYFRDLTTGIGVFQFYKLGVSQTDPVIINAGSQESGLNLMDASGNWGHWMGADGMEAFVDKTNNAIVYGAIYFGTLFKDTNGGASYASLGSPDNKFGEWVTPYEQDPIAQDVLYAGFNQVYKSIDGGQSWTAISQLLNGNLDQLKVAPSNPNFMYASNAGTLYKTTTGGIGTWQTLTGFTGYITAIAIHPSDPNKIAIATNSNQKVYVSNDGGTSWESYLHDLPNFSALALVWQDNGLDGLYLGMNYGLYYIDTNTPNNWQPFSNNLPHVEVSELEINSVDNKIYVATYGRGIWSSDLFDATLNVDDLELNSVVMYPNPTDKTVTLTWDKGEQVTIKIYDTSGKLLFFSKNERLTTPKQINVSNYASGVYFVKINTLNGVVTKKLSVK